MMANIPWAKAWQIIVALGWCEVYGMLRRSIQLECPNLFVSKMYQD